MKRKLIATILLLAAINFNVHAEEVKTTEPVMNKIEYSSIDRLILSRNTTVKTNENTIDKLYINFSSLDDAEDDLKDSINDMENLLESMKNISSPYTKQNVAKPADDAAPMDFIIFGINENVNAIISSLEAANKKNIDTLSENIDSMEEQLDNIKDQKLDMHKLINKMKVQTEMINNQMVWTGENLILAYNSLEIEKENIDRNLVLLQSQLKALNIKKELGLVAEIDVENLQLSIDDLNYNKKNLNTQQDNIKRQLNLLIAQPYDTQLEITCAPEINYDKIDTMNFQKDLDNSKDKSYALKIQEYELEAKQTAVDRSYDNDDEDDDEDEREQEYALALEDLDNEKLKAQDTERQYILSFKNLYEEVKDKKEALDIQKKKFEYQKDNLKSLDLRYSLGLISKMEYDSSKESYNNQEAKVESAKTDLAKSYKKYEWLLSGLTIK